MSKITILVFLVLFFIRLITQPQLHLTNNQTIRVTGTLHQEPKVAEKSQTFNLGLIKVVTRRYPEFAYGDQLQVEGKVVVTPIINFLGLYKISNDVLIYPKVSLVDESSVCKASPCRHAGGRLGWLTWVISLRNQLRNFYQTSLPSPADGIVAGVVLGDKSLIPKAFWDKLKLTGTLHIMVASGMNITLFSETVVKTFCLLVKRKQAVILLYLLIWFYVLLTGVTPPVIRAAIMASMVYLGQLIGREYDYKRILWLTGGTMLLLTPRLLFDVGFQLSFLATMGLVYLQPSMTKWQKYLFLFKLTSFSSSIAAITMTLPILITNFGQLNIIAPIINLSVLWSMPFILLGGGLFGVIGLVLPFVGKYLVLLLFPATFYVEQVISWFAKMTIFQVQIPKIGFVFWVLYYGVIWILVKKPLAFRLVFNAVKNIL